MADKKDPVMVSYVDGVRKTLNGPKAEVEALMAQARDLVGKIRMLNFKIGRPLPATDPQGAERQRRQGYIKEVQEAVESLRKLQASMEEKAMTFEFGAQDVASNYPEYADKFASVDTFRNRAAMALRANPSFNLGFNLDAPEAPAVAPVSSSMASVTPAKPAAPPAAASVPPATPASTRPVAPISADIIPAVAEAPMWRMHTRVTVPNVSLPMLHLLHTMQGLLADAAGSAPIPRPIANPAGAFAALYKIAKAGSLEAAGADEDTLVGVEEELGKVRMNALLPVAGYHKGFRGILKAARYSNAVEYVDLAAVDQAAVRNAAIAGGGAGTTRVPMVVDSDPKALEDLDPGLTAELAAQTLLAITDDPLDVSAAQLDAVFNGKDYFEYTRPAMARPVILMGYDAESSLGFARSLSAVQVQLLQERVLNIAGYRYRCAGLLLQPVRSSYADLQSSASFAEGDAAAAVQKKVAAVAARYRDLAVRNRVGARLADVEAEMAAIKDQLVQAGVSV